MLTLSVNITTVGHPEVIEEFQRQEREWQENKNLWDTAQLQMRQQAKDAKQQAKAAEAQEKQQHREELEEHRLQTGTFDQVMNRIDLTYV